MCLADINLTMVWRALKVYPLDMVYCWRTMSTCVGRTAAAAADADIDRNARFCDAIKRGLCDCGGRGGVGGWPCERPLLPPYLFNQTDSCQRFCFRFDKKKSRVTVVPMYKVNEIFLTFLNLFLFVLLGCILLLEGLERNLVLYERNVWQDVSVLLNLS